MHYPISSTMKYTVKYNILRLSMINYMGNVVFNRETILHYTICKTCTWRRWNDLFFLCLDKSRPLYKKYFLPYGVVAYIWARRAKTINVEIKLLSRSKIVSSYINHLISIASSQYNLLLFKASSRTIILHVKNYFN